MAARLPDIGELPGESGYSQYTFDTLSPLSQSHVFAYPGSPVRYFHRGHSGAKKKVDYDTSDKEPSLVPTMTPKIGSNATGKLPEAEGVPTHVPASPTWPRTFFLFFT